MWRLSPILSRNPRLGDARLHRPARRRRWPSQPRLLSKACYRPCPMPSRNPSRAGARRRSADGKTLVGPPSRRWTRFAPTATSVTVFEPRSRRRMIMRKRSPRRIDVTIERGRFRGSCRRHAARSGSDRPISHCRPVRAHNGQWLPTNSQRCGFDPPLWRDRAAHPRSP